MEEDYILKTLEQTKNAIESMQKWMRETHIRNSDRDEEINKLKERIAVLERNGPME